MESTDFGTISLQPALALQRAAPLSFRPPAEVDRRTTRTLATAIFCASLGLHVALVLQAHGPAQRTVVRKRSQVEIQVTRPPTPVVIPPQVKEVPPPQAKPTVAPRQQPHISAPAPVNAPVVADALAEPPPPPDPPPVAGPVGDGAPGPAVVAAPSPPPPAPIVEAREGANYLKNPRPPYPRIASREGWEGTVLLRVRVLPNGKPAAVTVQKSSGHGALDSAAIDAVNAWTFVPATQGGNPVAGWVNVPIDFRLQ